MRHLKITRYYLVIFLVSFMFSPLSINAAGAEEDQPEFQRASVRLYTNEGDGTLWVQIKPNSDHYRELMVYLPDGTGVTLVLDDLFVSPPLKNFSSRLEFNFPARELIGKYWDNGSGHTTDIFGQDGVYTFYFAENIETEPENTWHEYIKNYELR